MWLATASGLSVGFGVGSVGGQLQLYHGLGSGAEVAGVAIGFSVNLPGIRTLGAYLKDLAWYSRTLIGALADPTHTLAVNRDLVAASLRGWAGQMGRDMRINLGFAVSATMGGGMVFGAPEAQYLPGLFVGVQGGYDANIEGLRVGVSADVLWGFSLLKVKFTRAYEVDAGVSMGLGTWGYSGGMGVQLAGTFFIPTNMPGWTDYI